MDFELKEKERSCLNENIERITIKYDIKGKILCSFAFTAVVQC